MNVSWLINPLTGHSIPVIVEPRLWDAKKIHVSQNEKWSKKAVFHGRGGTTLR